MWFCISCRSVSAISTCAARPHSTPPLLARTTALAVLVLDCGPETTWTTSPSLIMHRRPVGSTSPFFPVNTLALMRGAIAARALGVFGRYVGEVFRRVWVDHKKLDDPAVLAPALTESGFDAERLIEASSTPAVKAELIANTERAVERGAFGAPTFFIDGELWFGKDRLNDVEQAIVTRLSAAK